MKIPFISELAKTYSIVIENTSENKYLSTDELITKLLLFIVSQYEDVSSIYEDDTSLGMLYLNSLNEYVWKDRRNQGYSLLITAQTNNRKLFCSLKKFAFDYAIPYVQHYKTK